jgi:electron transport complex protein RnfE
MPGDVRRALWRENPLIVYLVGLCPALAVSNRVSSALLMSAAVLFVLLGTGAASGAAERFLPRPFRLPFRLLTSAALTTVFERFLAAWAPQERAALGVYLLLVAVNCLVLGPPAADAGSPADTVRGSLAAGAGFIAVLVPIALVREVLGAGTITLFPVGAFGGVLQVPRLSPARVLAAAPGALLLLGYLGALGRKLPARRGDGLRGEHPDGGGLRGKSPQGGGLP